MAIQVASEEATVIMAATATATATPDISNERRIDS
ncbi:MAG: hypothetical protein J07HQW1_01910 [Haloquadratum walsbyi J07HQW1]|uniref:Uncharacterized protein n=1 Tax=Haloquadratum walsbyi J07HQW1 TaxID=1238424 RepID=U1PIA4_9EURY|nr:MAG: hypothetical protein J07HQW1_01910 [Haloquadratum walsbyi J07HQW1]